MIIDVILVKKKMITNNWSLCFLWKKKTDRMYTSYTLLINDNYYLLYNKIRLKSDWSCQCVRDVNENVID